MYGKALRNHKLCGRQRMISCTQPRLQYMAYCVVTKRKSMTNEKPDVIPKGRYTLKEAAQKLDISITTIYRYVSSNIINCLTRSNGQRVILGSEITRFWGGEYI